MDAEFAEFQFCGKVQSVAEEELGISLSEDTDMQFARGGRNLAISQWKAHDFRRPTYHATE